MLARFLLVPLAPLAVLALPQPALAQAAAETATILSGTGQGTGSASRAMGGNVAGAMNRASSAIRGSGGSESGGRSADRGGRGGGQLRLRMGYAVTTGPDALEGTDAAAYRMSSGATIRTSGTLRQPSAAAACAEACPEVPAPAEGGR